MKTISENFALLQNLINTAKWHKENCNKSCNVSLYQLKKLALLHCLTIPENEVHEATRLVNEMDII